MIKKEIEQIDVIKKFFDCSFKKAEKIFYKIKNKMKSSKNTKSCIFKNCSGNIFDLFFDFQKIKYFIFLCDEFCYPIEISRVKIFKQEQLLKTKTEIENSNKIIENQQKVKELNKDKIKQYDFIIKILSNGFLINKDVFCNLDKELNTNKKTHQTKSGEDISLNIPNGKKFTFEVFSTFDPIGGVGSVLNKIKENFKNKLDKYNEKTNFIIFDLLDELNKSIELKTETERFSIFKLCLGINTEKEILDGLDEIVKKEEKVKSIIFISNRFSKKITTKIFEFSIMFIIFSNFNERFFNYCIHKIIKNNIPYEIIDKKIKINICYENMIFRV